MLLAGAMVIAAIPLSFASPVKAAEENILKGKKTTCTYQGDSGHACKKAVDEKLNTSRWGSNNKTPQAIQIDLGDVYEIDTVKAYLFGKDRKYTYEYYVTMEPTILEENGGNGDDNFVGKDPVVTGLEGVGYGWADPDGKTPTPESEIRSEDYTFKGEKPVGRYLTLRITKCSHIVCLWDIQAFGKKVDAPAVKPKGDLILEAEKGILSGKCRTRDADSCSNGQYVGYIGEAVDNTVTWKANVETAGIYTLEAYFLSKKERSLEFKVNDDAKTILNCQAGADWDNTVVKSDNAITVKLKAGENTIVMGNDDGEAPNVDCVALTLKEATKEPETENTDTETKEPDTENTDTETEEPDTEQDTENTDTETEEPDTENTDTETKEPDTENTDTETEESDTENTDTETKEPDTEQDIENTDTENQKPDETDAEDTENREPYEPDTEQDTDIETEQPDTEQDTDTEKEEPDTEQGTEDTETKEPDTEKTESETQEQGNPGTETTEQKKPEEDKIQNLESSGENTNQKPQPQPQPNQQIPTTELPSIVLKGDIYWYKNLEYRVTNADATGKGTVELVGTKNKKVTSVIVPATVEIEGQKYNVTSIGKNAFKNCKKLKKIVIKTAQVKKVGKNALKGIKANAEIKVPASKLKKYTQLFEGNGRCKNVRIVK